MQSAALTPADAAALARCPAVRGLIGLHLGSNPIGDGGAAALAAADWPRLADLYIPDCGIGDAGAAALAGSNTMPELQRLWLVGNPIDRAGCAALAGGRFPRLRSLGTDANPLGWRGDVGAG